MFERFQVRKETWVQLVLLDPPEVQEGLVVQVLLDLKVGVPISFFLFIHGIGMAVPGISYSDILLSR